MNIVMFGSWTEMNCSDICVENISSVTFAMPMEPISFTGKFEVFISSRIAKYCEILVGKYISRNQEHRCVIVTLVFVTEVFLCLHYAKETVLVGIDVIAMRGRNLLFL